MDLHITIYPILMKLDLLGIPTRDTFFYGTFTSSAEAAIRSIYPLANSMESLG